MTFSPDFDRLLKKPGITKPHEEFELPPPQDEEAEPILADELPAALPREADLLEQLYNEAVEVQDLIDLLTDTAEPFEVTVPAEDRELLGERITTQDYLASVGNDDFRARRTRDHYEFNMLRGCGENYAWPVLAVPDLTAIQNGLLSAGNVVEGALLEAAQIPSGSASWKASSIDSRLGTVHQSLIENSKTYRLQLGHVVLSMRQDATSELLTELLNPVLSAQERELKAQLGRAIRVLKHLRFVLCKAQFLMAVEFRQVRDALLALAQEKILEQLLQMLTVLLHQVQGALVDPILDLFEKGVGGGPLMDRVNDRVSQEIGVVVGATLQSLTSQYTDLAADLLRATRKESNERLKKLRVLGQRNVVGRWVGHLNRVISILERVRNETTLADVVRQRMLQSLLERHATPESPTLKRIELHPTFQEIREQEFTMGLSIDGSEVTPREQQAAADLSLKTPDLMAPFYRSDRSTLEERSQ